MLVCAWFGFELCLIMSDSWATSGGSAGGAHTYFENLSPTTA